MSPPAPEGEGVTGAGFLEGEAAESWDLVSGNQVVEIAWNATPFRADRFEEAWRPWAEAAVEYGALWQVFLRGQDDQWIFRQISVWPSKLDFERYWYSEEISAARAAASGLFDVPILPAWFYPVSHGVTARRSASR